MSQNEEVTTVDQVEDDVHPIPKTVTPPPKPKKVLTEAQKLAFMKGREKRAANIQQRKLEQQQHPDVIPTTPPKTKAAEPHVDYDLLADKLAERLSAKTKRKEETPPPSPPKKRVYTRRVEIDDVPPPMPPPPPRIPQVKRATAEFNWM